MDTLVIPLTVTALAVLAAVWLLDRLSRRLRRHARRQRHLRRLRRAWRERQRVRRRAWLVAQWRTGGGRALNGLLFKKVWQVWLVSLLAHIAILVALGMLVSRAAAPQRGAFRAVTGKVELPPQLLEQDLTPDVPDDNTSVAGAHASASPNEMQGDALAALIVSGNPAAIGALPVSVNVSANLAATSGRGTGRNLGPKGLDIPTLNLGGMDVPTDVAVVCDISGSMDVYLRAITAQIKEQFPGLPVFYADNARGDFGKKKAPARSQWNKELSSYENLYDAIRAAIRSSGRIKGVYVMSDLQDGDTPAATEQLLAELQRRHLKLYLCYPMAPPYSGFEPLLAYARATGGVEKFRRR